MVGTTGIQGIPGIKGLDYVGYTGMGSTPSKSVPYNNSGSFAGSPLKTDGNVLGVQNTFGQDMGTYAPTGSYGLYGLSVTYFGPDGKQGAIYGLGGPNGYLGMAPNVLLNNRTDPYFNHPPPEDAHKYLHIDDATTGGWVCELQLRNYLSYLPFSATFYGVNFHGPSPSL